MCQSAQLAVLEAARQDPSFSEDEWENGCAYAIEMLKLCGSRGYKCRQSPYTLVHQKPKDMKSYLTMQFYFKSIGHMPRTVLQQMKDSYNQNRLPPFPMLTAFEVVVEFPAVRWNH